MKETKNENEKRGFLVILLAGVATIINNPVYAQEIKNLPISDDTYNKVDDFIEQYPQYEDYIKDVMKDIETSAIATDEEKINECITDTIEQLYLFEQKVERKYQAVIEKQECLLAEKNEQSRTASTETYDACYCTRRIRNKSF